LHSLGEDNNDRWDYGSHRRLSLVCLWFYLGRQETQLPPLSRPYLAPRLCLDLGRDFPLADFSLTPAAESGDARPFPRHGRSAPISVSSWPCTRRPNHAFTAKAYRLSDTSTRGGTTRCASRDGSICNGCSRSTSNEPEPRLRGAPFRIEVRRARR